MPFFVCFRLVRTNFAGASTMELNSGLSAGCRGDSPCTLRMAVLLPS